MERRGIETRREENARENLCEISMFACSFARRVIQMRER